MTNLKKEIQKSQALLQETVPISSRLTYFLAINNFQKFIVWAIRFSKSASPQILLNRAD